MKPQYLVFQLNQKARALEARVRETAHASADNVHNDKNSYGWKNFATDAVAATVIFGSASVLALRKGQEARDNASRTPYVSDGFLMSTSGGPTFVATETRYPTEFDAALSGSATAAGVYFAVAAPLVLGWLAFAARDKNDTVKNFFKSLVKAANEPGDYSTR